MDTMIAEKISEITTRRKHNEPIEHGSSSSAITTRTTNFTQTGRTRDQSIIIHGVQEGDRDDKQYITKFFSILEMTHTGQLTAHRLGMKQDNRQRPLKVTMKTLEEKEQLMSRLGLLWGAENEFKNISVTHDYTVGEREEIRRWVKMANQKTTNEASGYVWKARGTPKTGMRLIRLKQN